MTGPRDTLLKARAARRPAPTPRAVPVNPEPPATPVPAPRAQAPARRIAPQPVGGHAIYRALMRSHDRMGTRHLGKG